MRNKNFFINLHFETTNQQPFNCNQMKTLRTLYAVMMLTALALVNMSFSSGEESKSRIVEDGGTGPYKAIMKEEPTLPAHTVFAPQDLTKFGKKQKLPVLVWGNGACTNSPWEHYKFGNGLHPYERRSLSRTDVDNAAASGVD